MPSALEEMTQRLMAYKTGEMVSLMAHLGIRMGLYEAMTGKDSVSVDDLATGTGLHRRWVLEWLRQQTSAGVTEYIGEEHFRLPAEVSELVLDDTSNAYLGWLFHPPVGGERLDRMIESFRTGLGMSWDDHGAEGAHMVARSTGVQHRLLASQVLPLMQGVVEKLEL